MRVRVPAFFVPVRFPFLLKENNPHVMKKRHTLRWAIALLVLIAGASGLGTGRNEPAADSGAAETKSDFGKTRSDLDETTSDLAETRSDLVPASADAAASRPAQGRARLIEQPGRMGRGVPERIVSHTGYTLSFNRTHLQPNWVAWELTADETAGTVSRSDDFNPDPSLPRPQQVTTADYTRSGYDRGHQCPAADMKWSSRAMEECFYMSNICPQAPELNRGSWQTLEKACRRWAKAEGSIYIVCGPVFESGRKRRTIGREHRISVPDGFFKVVLSLRRGHEKAIGFYFANNASRQSLADAARTVDEIEALTGINFYVNLSRPLEQRLERTASLKVWH